MRRVRGIDLEVEREVYTRFMRGVVGEVEVEGVDGYVEDARWVCEGFQLV